MKLRGTNIPEQMNIPPLSAIKFIPEQPEKKEDKMCELGRLRAENNMLWNMVIDRLHINEQGELVGYGFDDFIKLMKYSRPDLFLKTLTSLTSKQGGQQDDTIRD